MQKNDAKLLGSVYGLLLEHGALSVERISNLLGPAYCARDFHWAFYQLDCKEGAGLWSLPDRMLPVYERTAREHWGEETTE